MSSRLETTALPTRRITLPDLLAATGRDERDLWDLRRRGLFPFKPEHTHVAGRRGSTSDYAFDALDYLQCLAEVQRQFPRKADAWLWCMWLDPADWPVDMRAWVLARLDRLLDKTMRAKAAGSGLKPGTERRLGGGRVRNAKSRRAASDWLLAWALGNERPELYSAAPEGIGAASYFDLLLRLVGPPFEGLPVLRFGAQRERVSERGGPYWLARFRRLVARVPDRDIEQARRDCRAISSLIEAVQRVDWNRMPAPPTIGLKREPPSWAARKERRVRRKPAPDFIRGPVEDWRVSFDYRALIFGPLLILRLLCTRASKPQLPDFMLAMAQQWLEALPQIAHAPNAGSLRPSRRGT